jgi:nucleolar protein 58
VVCNSNVAELMRGIRAHIEALVGDVPTSVRESGRPLTHLMFLQELKAMALGLAHSISRYKLKFSPDKVDTMIIQAVCEFAHIVTHNILQLCSMILTRS